MRLLKTLTATTAAVALALVATTGPASAIIGGTDVHHPVRGMANIANTFPAIGIEKCAGAVIAARWLVMPADCASDVTVVPAAVPVDPKQIQIRVGSTQRTSGGYSAHAKRVILHPDWAWGTLPGAPAADVALVELDRAVPGPYMRVADWPSWAGRRLDLLGWGLETWPVPAGTPLPEQLHHRAVRQLPATACTGGGITAGEICAGPGTCFGDGVATTRSGPYGHGRTAVGVASRETSDTDPCGSPVIYTDLGTYAGWIHTTIRTGICVPNRHTARTFTSSATQASILKKFLVTMSK